ncbi:hypothetical protein [Bailinhaonella thermotolerans]|uniref:Uncharacterized protein n=1 Tax=Bailinhaonella thermotolerans TaxID=1070861 RepID=A0A3A4AWZ8_9ACTN|nr:hypothetical protein [Bailinhaonella thermotolerans]RJL33403.1 hypothetical protein D5H75_11470 [Bailinhaonella thermotolerans]
MRSRWQRYQREALEKDMAPAAYATRARRRVIAGLAAFSVALLWVDAAVSWFLAPSDLAVTINFVLLAIMLVIYLPAVTLLNVASRGTAALPARMLDERQAAERLRAVATGHRITFGLIGLALAAVVAGTWGEGDTARIPAAAVFILLLAIWLTHLVMPLIIVGWRMPDPVPDEDDERDEHDDA